MSTRIAPHAGRGGWTWYTGSAGWMYRLIVESLLGVSLEVDRLRFLPNLPASWSGFSMRYRFGETYYDIAVLQPAGGAEAATRGVRVTLDGIVQADGTLPLADDRGAHRVKVEVLAGAP